MLIMLWCYVICLYSSQKIYFIAGNFLFWGDKSDIANVFVLIHTPDPQLRVRVLQGYRNLTLTLTPMYPYPRPRGFWNPWQSLTTLFFDHSWTRRPWNGSFAGPWWDDFLETSSAMWIYRKSHALINDNFSHRYLLAFSSSKHSLELNPTSAYPANRHSSNSLSPPWSSYPI